jgi:hypothetical protein
MPWNADEKNWLDDTPSCFEAENESQSKRLRDA